MDVFISSYVCNELRFIDKWKGIIYLLDSKIYCVLEYEMAFRVWFRLLN